MSSILLYDSVTLDLDQFIETTSKYFGISDKQYTYTHNIHLFSEGMMEMGQEVLIDRTKLIKLIKQNLINYNMQLTEVFVSKYPIPIENIKDSFGKVIFDKQGNSKGWFVFVDPCKIANWSHTCEYWFVINETEAFYSKTEQWKPWEELEIEQIPL